MASYQRLKEVGEYNYSAEFLVDRQQYRIVVMYGINRVNHGGYCEDEPAAQAFVIRLGSSEHEPDDIMGYHLFFITPGIDPSDVLEESLIVALDQACFSEKQKKYILHWVLGETIPLKSEIEE